MRNRQRPATIREALTLLALVTTLAVAAVLFRRYQEVRDVLRQLALRSDRSLVHDRLIGAHIDLDQLGIHALEPGKAGTILWILNLDECAGCLDSVAPWEHLTEQKEYRLLVLLSGTQTPEVVTRMRALQHTSIYPVSISTIESQLGSLLSNTKLLVHPDGYILMADSRNSGQECGWAFESQVAALLGWTKPEAIRAED